MSPENKKAETPENNEAAMIVSVLSDHTKALELISTNMKSIYDSMKLQDLTVDSYINSTKSLERKTLRLENKITELEKNLKMVIDRL